MSTSELDYNASTGDLAADPLGGMTYVTVVEGCGCAICQSFRDAGPDSVTSIGGINDANPEGQNIGVLLSLITNPDGSRSFTGIRNVDAALIGSKWGTLDLTYSFPTSGSNYNGTGFDSNGVSFYHQVLGTEQQAAARAGFAQIAAFTNLKFTEIVETDAVHANFRISQSGSQAVTSAYGGFPSDTSGVAGDMWFGRTSQPYYDLAHKGTWGFSTMLHEIGHTVGLKHGHQDYTYTDLSFYFGSTPRYGSQALTPDRDGQAWSLMTYTPAPFTGSGFAGEKVNQPQTFMQYDIAAMQYMYGANFDTNAGDSTYTFSQTTGEMFINGVGQGAPSGNKILLTIWDGGGNDTIDGSNYAGGVTIDLRPGEFSTVDQAQLANHLALSSGVALAPGNIAMSLLYNNDGRSLIENAKGGAGNDIFVGNIANNVLDGGAGSDTVIFTSTTGVNVTLNDTGADVIVVHDGETDTLRSIENIGGTSGNDTLTGNGQDNTLTGGSGGADTLSGGGGNDRLIGGGFTVGAKTAEKADIIKTAAQVNDTPASAVNLVGAFDLTENNNIVESTTLPHATVVATASGGGYELYRFEVTAGTRVTLDIDGTSADFNSVLDFVDATGVRFGTAVNNDAGGDPGSDKTTDSSLTFVFATAGTYYARVSQVLPGGTTISPLTAGQTYTLHVSVSSAALDQTFFSVNTSTAQISGGEGDDFLQGTLGNDTLDGGTGNDTASFATAFSTTALGVTADLTRQGVAQDTVAAGSDTLVGIENLIGSKYNDTLTGDDRDNVIEGGLGNDALAGGAGNDTASYAGATAGVSVSLASGAAQNTGSAGSDTLSGFENLQGSSFNDSLTGDASANTLSGGAGDDTLNPGANAAGAVDLLDGGAGSDTASFAGTASVTATLNGETDGTATIGGVTVANLRNVENLLGSANADVLTGDANANVINGGLGNDSLDGGAGVDTVSFTGNGTAAITVNLATTVAQATGAGSKTIVNFENVRTGAGADNVTGDGNDNIFFEGGGADVYNGAAGSDTVDYSAATSTVTVNLNTTTAQNTGTFGGSDTITNVENAVGAASFANTLTGNTAANRLVGGSSADTLTGGAGADSLSGGAGNDILVGDISGVASGPAGATEATTTDGADVIEGGAGNDTIVGGLGADTLRGGDGDDTIVGGVGTVSTTALTAVSTSAGGNDVFDGGEGTDLAYAYYTGRAGGVTFDLANIQGDSAILLNGVNVGSFTSIERVVFRGGVGNDNVRGGGTLDTLVGNEGDDVLDGWYGNDTLSGGLGNDTLIGGEGLDTATYVNSAAGVTVDLRIQGVAQNTGGEGSDTLVSIEYLTGSNFGDTLRGDDGFNRIVDDTVSGPAGQTDSLFGYGGNDSIFVTRAAAAVATNVNIDGGDGDDFLEVRSGTLSSALATNAAALSGNTYAALGTTGTRYLDTVVVDGGAGNDRIVLTGVKSAVVNAGSGDDTLSLSLLGSATESKHTVTLGAGQDTIQLAGIGSGASTVDHGNVVTDFQVGNAGDRFEMTQFLNGVIPATTTPVAPANPTLVGYTLNPDAFASGHLALVQSGTDLLLQVDRDAGGSAHGLVTVFTISNGYTGGFTTYNFDGFIGELTLTGFGTDETITGATKNDTLTGNGGNDVLIGLGGNDKLDGGSGNDTLDGGTGDDQMSGGADNDTYVVGQAGDMVTELVDEGTDLVQSAIDYTLGANVENLTLTGTAIKGTGNEVGNVITGNELANTLEGMGGNDTMDGGVGTDTLLGGAGDDTLNGGEDADTLEGGADRDTLNGEAGGDTLRGDAGDDQLNGGTGDDSLTGGEGADVLDGGEDVDVASYRNATAMIAASLMSGLGTEGDAKGDTFIGIENLEGGKAGDKLDGNSLANLLIGNEGDDTLKGGAGNDRLVGGAGGDTLDGGDGFDTASYRDAASGVNVVISNAGRITVTGGDTGDTLISIEQVEGSSHADTFTGSTNNDNLSGGGGDDTLNGGNGLDKLDGGAGNDKLDGGNGNDQLFGRAGNDTIVGGTGNDIIDGGANGDIGDILTGGSGSDMFIFQSAADIGKLGGAHDVITDFQAGVDKIDLSGLFGGSGPVAINFAAPPTEAAANTVYVYTENGKTFVVGDNDGKAGLDFGLELTGTPKLKASDFVMNQTQWNDFFAKAGSPTEYSAFHDGGLIV